MEIKELKDLELVKNELEDYVKNSEEAVKKMKGYKLPQDVIESLEKSIVCGKKLINDLNIEINYVLNNN